MFDCYAEWLLSSGAESYQDWSPAILQIFTELRDRRLIVTEKRICFSQIKSVILNLLTVWSQLRAGCILSRFSDFCPKYRDHRASCVLTMFPFSTSSTRRNEILFQLGRCINIRQYLMVSCAGIVISRIY